MPKLKSIKYSTSTSERLRQRNEKVRQFFEEFATLNPQWRLDALLKRTAEEFPPISTATVSAIIKKNGKYKD